MKKKDIPDHFCPQPFTYIHAGVEGGWKPCCKSDILSKVNTFDEWWFEDEDLKQLRHEMLTKPGKMCASVCNIPCYDPERSGRKSYRNSAYDHFMKNDMYFDIVENYSKTGMAISNNRLFILKPKGLGNYCNLKCYMCPPHLSSSRSTEMIKTEPDSIQLFYKKLDDPKGYLQYRIDTANKTTADMTEKYLDIIDSFGDCLKSINLSGGEPTMIKGFIPILDKLVEDGHAKEMNLFFNSNMTRLSLLKNNFTDYFDKFGSVTIQASVDNVGKKDEWMRYPTKFGEVEETIKYLRDTYSNIDISVNTTWSLLNIDSAFEIAEFLEENDLPLAFPMNYVDHPRCLNLRNYPHKQQLYDKYINSDISWIRELAKNIISEDVIEEDLKKAIDYIKNLDTIRNTDARDLWPWLKEYYND